MPTQTFLNLPPEKQDRILQAAIKEFGQRNVVEANLSHIVQDAGISRGSLYQYFPSKEDMYIYIFDTLRAERAEYVKPVYALYKREPFLKFFEAFYLRDSEYLLQNPSHIELGKQLYSHAHGVSRRLITQLQSRYRDTFLLAIDYDKERGLIDKSVDAATLADLCVHFVTDIFIFQNVSSQLSLSHLREYAANMMHILDRGLAPR